MSALPFWIGGGLLAAVVVFHWLLLHRMMAVSGRITALVDRTRHGVAEPEPQMSAAELAAAMEAATREAFGESATASAQAVPEPAARAPLPRQRPITHLVFFGSVFLGGLVSFLATGGGDVSTTLRSSAFAAAFGSGPVAGLALAAGGVLVGFGTRMAGGCTSGHGLCGTSRFQVGSLVTTATFFGTAVLVSFALGALS